MSGEMIELRERIEDLEALVRSLVRYQHPDFPSDMQPVCSTDMDIWKSFGRDG